MTLNCLGPILGRGENAVIFVFREGTCPTDSRSGSLVVWGPVVWIPGIPLWKGLLPTGTPESQTNPNQQFTIWATKKTNPPILSIEILVG